MFNFLQLRSTHGAWFTVVILVWMWLILIGDVVAFVVVLFAASRKAESTFGAALLHLRRSTLIGSIPEGQLNQSSGGSCLQE